MTFEIANTHTQRTDSKEGMKDLHGEDNTEEERKK